MKSSFYLGKKLALLGYARRLVIRRRFRDAALVLRDRRLGYEAMHWAALAPADCHVVVDAGAHVGSTSAALDLALRPDKLIAIEPNPALQSGLRSRFARQSHVQVLSCALGATQSTIAFFAHRFSAASSCFPARAGYLAEMGLDPGSEQIEVECRRLDVLMAELGIRSIDLLKIDCQGSELQVLTGAGDLLQRVRCVVTEVLFERVYEGGCVFSELHAFLLARNFRLVHLDRFLGPSDSIQQADAVYLNPSLG